MWLLEAALTVNSNRAKADLFFIGLTFVPSAPGGLTHSFVPYPFLPQLYPLQVSGLLACISCSVGVLIQRSHVLFLFVLL